MDGKESREVSTELTALIRQFTGVLERRLEDHDLLVEIAAGQKAMIDSMKQNQRVHAERLEDHEARIRTLEKWQMRVIGGAGAVCAATYMILHALAK